MNIDTLSAKKAGKIIDEAKEDITERRGKINQAASPFEKNLYRGQIESREAIIKKLNTKFFN